MNAAAKAATKMITVRRDFCSGRLCSAGMGFLDAHVTAEVPNARGFDGAESAEYNSPGRSAKRDTLGSSPPKKPKPASASDRKTRRSIAHRALDRNYLPSFTH